LTRGVYSACFKPELTEKEIDDLAHYLQSLKRQVQALCEQEKEQ
jgi:hypothetical protein